MPGPSAHDPATIVPCPWLPPCWTMPCRGCSLPAFAWGEFMATTQSLPPAINLARNFHVGIAAFVVAFTFIAFTATYWAPMTDGSLQLHAAVHVHAALFFVWTLFYLGQTVLASRGRILLHRELGMAGIALAGLMVFSGVLVVVVNLASAMGAPRERVVVGTSILAITAMILFTAYMTAAIVNIRRPEWHKRLMVLATFSLLQAVVARYVLLVPDLIQPQRALISAIIVDLMLAVVTRASTGAFTRRIWQAARFYCLCRSGVRCWRPRPSGMTPAVG
jgi:hypothetical protein